MNKDEVFPQAAENAKNDVIENSSPTISFQAPKRSLFKKRTLIILLLVIIILVPFGVWFFLKTDISSKDANNVLLATVGEKKIYKNEVKDLALDQYSPSAVTEKVIQLFLNIAIERSILDREVELLNIDVRESDYVKSEGLSKPELDLAKYSYIKNQIMQKRVKSVSAYKIGFWIASYDYPQKPEYEIQRREGLEALKEIETALLRGDEPTIIASYIMNKYKSLKDLVSINGYRFAKAVDIEILNKPKLYTYNPADIGKSSNDDEVSLAFSLINKGEVKKIVRSDGSGGDVIKAISVSSEGYSSYDDFLSQRKKELLIIQSEK